MSNNFLKSPWASVIAFLPILVSPLGLEAALHIQGTTTRIVTINGSDEGSVTYTNNFELLLSSGIAYSINTYYDEVAKECYSFDGEFLYGAVRGPLQFLEDPNSNKPVQLDMAAISRERFQPIDAFCTGRFIWLAFLTRDWFKKVEIEGFVVPWASAASLGSESYLITPIWVDGCEYPTRFDIVFAEAKWQREAKRTKQKLTSSPYHDGEVVGSYEVVEFTNSLDRTLPAHFQLARYGYSIINNERKRVRLELYHGVVAQVATVADSALSLPSLEGFAYSINDFRHPFEREAYRDLNVRYRITNHVWLKPNDPWLFGQFQEAKTNYQAHLAALYPEPKEGYPLIAKIATLLLLIVASMPVAIYLFRRLRRG